MVAASDRMRAALRRLRRAAVLPRRRPDVTLVMAPPWGVNRPPLNLAYLASYLRCAGVRVSVRDFNIEAFDAAEARGLGHHWTIGTARRLSPLESYRGLARALVGPTERFLEELLASDAPVLAFSINSGNRHFVWHLVTRLRRADPRRTLLIGGPEVLRLVWTGRLRAFPADHAVLGEGEQTLLELVRRRLSGGGGATCPVPGALPRMDNLDDEQQRRCVAGFVPRPPILDLDRIPFPTYDELPLSRYRSEVLSFLFSRGCQARCVFCADRLHQVGFRCRSGDHGALELAHHYHRHGRRLFAFNDLACNADLGRLRRLCELIRALRLELLWNSYALVTPEMTGHDLRLMHQAGCTHLRYGVESGSDRVLQLMRKPFTAKMARQALRRTAEAGIRTSVNIIVGYPGETEQDFEATLRFLRHNRAVIHQVGNLSTPVLMPGTDLTEQPRRHGVEGLDARTSGRRLEIVERVLEELAIPLRIINRGHEATPEPRDAIEAAEVVEGVGA